jgi:hypothetical protein
MLLFGNWNVGILKKPLGPSPNLMLARGSNIAAMPYVNLKTALGIFILPFPFQSPFRFFIGREI